MNLLLDTHVALWAITGDARLPDAIAAMIGDARNEVFISAASIWEIALKHGLARGGPNDMPLSGAQALTYFDEAGYRMLPITPDHAAAIETLPPLHGDPFDRLLIAQALTEPLRLLTHDSRIAAYGEPVMWF